MNNTLKVANALQPEIEHVCALFQKYKHLF